MKRMSMLNALAVVSALAGPLPAQGQNIDPPAGRNHPLPSGDGAVTDSGVMVLYPPAEVPSKTCVYNNVIHSAGARICVGYDLATCTEAGTWDISEKGARDAPRCNR